jgi:hypothetical protein
MEEVNQELRENQIINMVCRVCEFPYTLIPVPRGLLRNEQVDDNDLVCLGCADGWTPGERGNQS